jgi:hypothetical protein
VVIPKKRLHEISTLLFAVCFLVGVIFFACGPYSQRGDTFVDKMGRPVTATAYHYFQWWERTFWVLWLLFAFFTVRRAIQHYERTGSLRRGAAPK